MIDPLTLTGIAVAAWAAKTFGFKPGPNPVNPPLPFGQREEPCYEGPIGELKRYKWLAVPRSRRHQFALGGKVSSAGDFIEAWRRMALKDRRAGSACATVIVSLTAAQDRYPDHTLLVVNVA